MNLQPRPPIRSTTREEGSSSTSPRPSCSRLTPSEDETHVGMCPYFGRERSQGVVSCEGARLKFPDRDARREILYRFCAHPEGYKACMIKQALDHYYERKSAQHE